MEIWHTYKFLRYAKNKINEQGNIGYQELQKLYRAKTNLNGDEVFDLWDGCIEQKLIEADNANSVHIRVEGRRLLEGKLGPVSIGLLTAEIKEYYLWILIIFGGSSLYGFVDWLFHLFKAK